ncbi:MAG: tetratricopeptide repeat protein [Candidatus Omnitrophica bacterium]|nr:tetratricopeptide repeat protein [Candidatus Omnitrophota bacterium]
MKMKSLKPIIIPNAILSLVFALTMQYFIWKRYFAEDFYLKATSIYVPEVAIEKTMNYKRLLRYLDKSIALNGLNAKYYFESGNTYLRVAQEGFEGMLGLAENGNILAKNQFLTAITLDPVMGRYHLDLAKAFFSLNQPENAQREFLKTEELDFSNAAIHYEIAKYYISISDKRREALREYKRALYFADRKFRLGILEDLYANYTADYKSLSKIVPNTDYNRYSFAEFLREKKRFAESLKEYKKSIVLTNFNINKHLKPEALNWIAIIYLWQGKFSLAAEYFNKAISLSQDKVARAWMFHNLGNTYLKIGDAEKAKEAFEKSGPAWGKNQ